MAKKEKLKTDDFSLDNELNYDDFNFEGDFNPEVKNSKNRTPVEDVFQGTVSGAGSKLKDPSFLASMVKRSLPDTFGEIADATGTVVDNATQLYDHAVRELKPQAGRLAKKIDRLVPDDSKTAKSITQKLVSIFSDEQSNYRAPSKEQIQDQSISMGLAQIFGEQQASDQKQHAENLATDQIRDNISRKEFRTNLGVLSSIEQSVSRMSKYNEKITQAVQKKSLELQYRSLFVMKDLADTTRHYFEVFKNQNEGIVKNTALPEYAKITASERFKDIAKNKFYGGVQDKFFGKESALQKGLTRIKRDGKDYIEGIKQGIESASSGLDGYEQMQEMNQMLIEMGQAPITASNMAGTAAGGWLVDKFGRHVTDKIRDKLSGNKKLNDALYKGATAVNNIPGTISSLRKNERYKEMMNEDGARGKLLTGVNSTLSYFMDSSPDMTIKSPFGQGSGHMPAIFNESSSRSLNEIIPGYLARILREIKVLRTGDDSESLVYFDQKTGKFLDKKGMSSSIKKGLSDHIKMSSYGYITGAVTKKFTDGETVTDKQHEKIKDFISQLSAVPNIDYTPENIYRTEAFRNLDEDTKKLVKKIFDRKFTDEDQDKSKYELTKQIGLVRGATPDIRGPIEQLIKSGYGDVLQSQKLVKQNENGDYQIDEKAYLGLIRKEGLVTSDVRAKENISPLSPKTALNAVNNTPVYNWAYKKGLGDGGVHNGPMAQDVQKTMGDKAAPGGTKIDLTTMNGNNMAAIQELSKKVDEKEGQSPEYLKSIATDICEMRRIMEGKTTVEGNGGGSKLNTYQDILGSMFGSTGSLVAKTTGDLFSTGKDVTKSLVKGGLWLGDKAKDPIAYGFRKLMDAGAFAAKKALELGGKTITDYIPSGLKTIHKVSSKVKKTLSRFYNSARDVYIAGIDGPVLRASLIRAGYYYDSVTKKAITSMDDLANLKGDVVTKTGEMVLSAKDAARGMFDQHGKTIQSTLSKLVGQVVDLTADGLTRAKDAAGKILTTGKDVLFSGFGKLSKAGKAIGNKAANMEMPGIGVGGEKIYQVLVEIRGVLRGEDTPRHEDVLAKNKALRAESLKKTAESLKAKSKGFFDRFKKPADDFVGPMPQSVASKAKGRLTDLAGRLGGLFDKDVTQDDFVGPLPESASSKAKGKLADWKGQLSVFLQNGKVPVSTGAQSDFVGPLPESVSSKAKGKFDDWRGRLSSIFGKDENPESVEQVKPSTVSDSSKNKQKKGTSGKPWKQAKRKKGKKPNYKKLNDVRLDESDSEDDETTTTVTTSSPSLMEPAPAKYLPGKDIFSNIASLGSKAMDMLPTAKEGFSKAKEGIKGGKGIKGKLMGGIGALGSMFSGGDKKEETPEKKEPTLNPEQNTPAQEQPKTTTTTTTKKRGRKKGPKAFNDQDGSGRRDGDFRDIIEQREKKDEEAKSKLPGLMKAEAKYVPTTDIFDSIKNKASGVLGAAGNVLSTATSLMGMASAGGGFLKGIGKGLISLVKLVAAPLRAVGGATQAIGKASGLARVLGMANTVRNVAAFGALATGGAGGALMGGIAGAISVVGAVISSPVVLGAVVTAAAGYGIYRLYKYANRDSVNEFENIRMMQYGIGTGESTKKYNHFMLMLEEYLHDGRVGYDDGKAYLLDKKVKSEDMLEIFGIDKDDRETGSKLASWFSNRFKPFFLTHLTALFAADKKAKLKDIASLKPEAQLKYLNAVSFESGPYDADVSPFKDLPNLNTDKKFALNAIKALSARLQKDAKIDISKDRPPVVPPVAAKPKATAPVKELLPQETNSALADNKAANKDQLNPPGEDGFMKEMKPTGSIKDVKVGEGESKSSVGRLKLAEGPVTDGQAGMQYLNLQSGVTLDSMNPSMLKNLLAMAQEYGEKTGKQITLTSGSRTTAEQAELHRKDPRKAAPPGRSMHEFGLAADISSGDLDQLDELGLMRKYGFTRPVGREPWHMESAGIQVNLARAKDDPSFASTAIEASLFKGGGGIGSIPGTPLGKRDSAGALALMNDNGVQKVNDIASKSKGADVLPIASATPKETPKPDVSQAAEPKTASVTILGKKMSDTEKSDYDKTYGKPLMMNAMKTQDNYSAMNQMSKSKDIPEDGGAIKDMSSVKTASTKEGAGNPDVKQSIIDISKKQSVNPNEMLTMAAVESGLNPNAKASGSTAKGLFGFTNATWNDQLARAGSRLPLGNNPSPLDVEDSTLMATEYFKTNKKMLSGVKSDVNVTDVYMAHFLGPNGARKFFNANPSTPADAVLPNAAAANTSIFYKGGRALTVGEVYQAIDEKLGKKAKEFGISLKGGNTLNSKPETSNAAKLDTPPVKADDSGSAFKPATTAIEASNPPKPQTPVERPRIAPQAQTGISTPPVVSKGQAIGANMGSLDGIDTTLKESLVVQREMAASLKLILENVKAMANKETPSSSKGGETPQGASSSVSARNNVQQPDLKTTTSALDLRRRAV